MGAQCAAELLDRVHVAYRRMARSAMGAQCAAELLGRVHVAYRRMARSAMGARCATELLGRESTVRVVKLKVSRTYSFIESPHSFMAVDKLRAWA
jgi:hypothetical protein